MFYPVIPVYLPDELDVTVRMRLAENLARQGIKTIGIQFLFLKEIDLEVLDYNCLELVALTLMRFLQLDFKHVFFSVHLPWSPWNRFNLDQENDLEAHIQRITKFGKEFDLLINLHLVSDVPLDVFRREVPNFQEKQKRLETIAERLAKISQTCCINVENAPVPSSKPELINYLGCLPSDLRFVLERAPQASFTWDLCHSGIMAHTCRKIARGSKVVADFPGLYPEDMDDIEKLSLAGEEIFIDELGDKITHLHLSDFKGAVHGICPGEGDRSIETIKGLLKKVAQKKAELGSKEEIGVLLEVDEKDFHDPQNALKTALALSEFWQ